MTLALCSLLPPVHAPYFPHRRLSATTPQLSDTSMLVSIGRHPPGSRIKGRASILLFR